MQAHIARAAPAPHGPIGRLLEGVCGAVAMLGGLLLIAIMLVSSLSVIGRGLSLLFAARISGIPGDIELVQLGCAVAVFAFLPICASSSAPTCWLGLSPRACPCACRAMLRPRRQPVVFRADLRLGLSARHWHAREIRRPRHHHGAAHSRGVGLCRGAGIRLAVGDARPPTRWLRSALEIRGDRAIGPSPSGEH